TILLEVHNRRQMKVVGERSEQRGFGACPGINGLLVVPNREDVMMIARQRLDQPVLHGIQVLELVDENSVPSRSHRRSSVGALEQLCGFDDERVEVDQSA